MNDSTVGKILGVACWGSVAMGAVAMGLGLAVVGMAREGGQVVGEFVWEEVMGYEPYSIHTPWEVEKGYLPRGVAEEIRGKAKAQALGLERSAPGTLASVCSSWSIEATSDSVAEICSELKEELRTEEEHTEAQAQAHPLGAEAQAQTSGCC